MEKDVARTPFATRRDSSRPHRAIHQTDLDHDAAAGLELGVGDLVPSLDEVAGRVRHAGRELNARNSISPIGHNVVAHPLLEEGAEVYAVGVVLLPSAPPFAPQLVIRVCRRQKLLDAASEGFLGLGRQHLEALEELFFFKQEAIKELLIGRLDEGAGILHLGFAGDRQHGCRVLAMGEASGVASGHYLGEGVGIDAHVGRPAAHGGRGHCCAPRQQHPACLGAVAADLVPRYPRRQ